MCPQLGLHEGGRGTRGDCPRAASLPHAASMLVLLRAVFAVYRPAAMEPRHEQP
jgi:hypothetical protein